MATAIANQPQASSTFPPSLTWSFSVSDTVTGTWTASLWSAPYYEGAYNQLPVVVGSTQVTGTAVTAGTVTVTYGTPTTSYYYQVQVTGGGITGTVISSPLYFYSPYQGPQGVQGQQGTRGTQGPTGITGPQGQRGIQGLMEINNYTVPNQLLTSAEDSVHVNPNPTLTFNGTVLALTGNMNASGTIATAAGFTGLSFSATNFITAAGGFTGPSSGTINGISIDRTNQNVSAVGTLNTSGRITSGGGVSVGGTVTGVTTLNASGYIATSGGFTGPTVSTSGLISSGAGVAAGGPITGVTNINASGYIATSGGFTGPSFSATNFITAAGGFTGPSSGTINGISIGLTNQGMTGVSSINGIVLGAGTSSATQTISALGKISSGGFTGPTASTINGIDIDPLTKNMSAVGTISASAGSSSIGNVTLNNGTITGYLDGNISGSSATCRGNAATATNFSGTPDIIVGTIGCSVITATGKIYSGGFTGPAASTINGIGINPTNQNMSGVGTLNTSGTIATSGGFTGTNVSTSGLIFSGGFTGPAVSTINGININPTNQNISNVGTISASAGSSSIGGVTLNAGTLKHSTDQTTLTVNAPSGAATASAVDTLTVGAGVGTVTPGNAIKTTGTVSCGAITATGNVRVSSNIASGGSGEVLSLYNSSNVDNGVVRLAFGYGSALASIDGVISTATSPSTGALSFKTYSGSSYAEGLFISKDQRVGVNINTPAVPLDVNGNVHIATDAFQTQSPTNFPGQNAQLSVMGRYTYAGGVQTVNHIEIGSSRTDTSDQNMVNRYAFATYQNNTGGLDFNINQLKVAASSYAGALTTSTPFTIYRNGNVGINATVPRYKLDVNGSAGIGDTYLGSNYYGQYAYFQNTSLNAGVGGNYALMQDTNGQTFVNAASGQKIIFNTNNNAVANITASGLAINSSNAAAAYPLDVNGTIRAQGTAGGPINGNILLTTPDYQSAIYFLNAAVFSKYSISGPDSASAFQILYYPLVGGTTGVKLAAGATSWSAVSDSRLKTIIEPISNATSAFETITPVYYTLNTDAVKLRRIGVIAQEVLPHFPEAISEEGDGMYNLRYTDLVSPLITSVKELSARLSNVEAQLAART